MLLALEVGSIKPCQVAYRPTTFSSPNRSYTRSKQSTDMPRLLHRRKPRLKSPKQSNLKTHRGVKTVYADYTRLPFNHADYKRVKVHLVKTVSTIPPQGTLLLVKDTYDISDDEEIDPRGLLVHVGGDTLTAITFAASEREPERPMTLHLLYNILEYYRELQPLEWHLLHVAIVDIRDDVYIGRLYFGNPETGEIHWDCDCRPSDACWLSLKRMCPMYIRNAVWEACAQSMDKMFSSQVDIRSTLEKLGVLSDPATMTTTEAKDPLTEIRPGDPTVIKRLKRQMSVAVSEEDYKEAARIRDHPYMTKYKSILTLRKEGKHEEAHQIERELREDLERDGNLEEEDF